jgi:hypothetical protein
MAANVQQMSKEFPARRPVTHVLVLEAECRETFTLHIKRKRAICHSIPLHLGIERGFAFAWRAAPKLKPLASFVGKRSPDAWCLGTTLLSLKVPALDKRNAAKTTVELY